MPRQNKGVTMNKEQIKILTEAFWEYDEYSLRQRNSQYKEDIDYQKRKFYTPEMEYAYGKIEECLNLEDSLEMQMAQCFNILDNEDSAVPEDLYQDILNIYWENNYKREKSESL